MADVLPWTRMAAPILFIGGAHAGKSQLAMQALAPDQPATVLGTASALEPEFAPRLVELRSLRPSNWESLDVGDDLIVAAEEAMRHTRQILIDSLSQWLANLLIGVADADRADSERRQVLGDRLASLTQLMRRNQEVRFVIVSTEVGSCPAPPRPTERLFREQVGRANQALAGLCATVIAVQAGIGRVIKG